MKLCDCDKPTPLTSCSDEGTCCLVCDNCNLPVPDEYLNRDLLNEETIKQAFNINKLDEILNEFAELYNDNPSPTEIRDFLKQSLQEYAKSVLEECLLKKRLKYDCEAIKLDNEIFNGNCRSSDSGYNNAIDCIVSNAKSKFNITLE